MKRLYADRVFFGFLTILLPFTVAGFLRPVMVVVRQRKNGTTHDLEFATPRLHIWSKLLANFVDSRALHVYFRIHAGVTCRSHHFRALYTVCNSTTWAEQRPSSEPPMKPVVQSPCTTRGTEEHLSLPTRGSVSEFSLTHQRTILLLRSSQARETRIFLPAFQQICFVPHLKLSGSDC